jgi:predicted negative regulator of RcsB-dependent stress response
MTDIKGKSDSGMGGKILHFPQGPAFYAKRGDAKRAQNDPVNAIAMYNEALKRDSGSL